MGLGKIVKLDLSIDQINTLLTKRTDNNKIDTILEMIDAFEKENIIDIKTITNSEIDNIINN